MRKKALLLRAHHGLCIGYFRGEGYSGDFTRHMAEVISSLEPDTAVNIVCGPDEICAGCPNLAGGVCASQSKVAHFDRAVLELCGIEEGCQMRWAELRSLIVSRIISAGKRQEVCSDCEWNDICK